MKYTTKISDVHMLCQILYYFDFHQIHQKVSEESILVLGLYLYIQAKGKRIKCIISKIIKMDSNVA
jgi:hypothetical protein